MEHGEHFVFITAQLLFANNLFLEKLSRLYNKMECQVNE